jgi:hypothetical protein
LLAALAAEAPPDIRRPAEVSGHVRILATADHGGDAELLGDLSNPPVPFFPDDPDLREDPSRKIPEEPEESARDLPLCQERNPHVMVQEDLHRLKRRLQNGRVGLEAIGRCIHGGPLREAPLPRQLPLQEIGDIGVTPDLFRAGRLAVAPRVAIGALKAAPVGDVDRRDSGQAAEIGLGQDLPFSFPEGDGLRSRLLPGGAGGAPMGFGLRKEKHGKTTATGGTEKLDRMNFK